MKRTSEATLKTLKRGKLSFPLIKHTACMREKAKTETTGKAAAAAWWSFCVTAMQLSPASDKNKKGGVKTVLMFIFLIIEK